MCSPLMLHIECIPKEGCEWYAGDCQEGKKCCCKGNQSNLCSESGTGAVKMNREQKEADQCGGTS